MALQIEKAIGTLLSVKQIYQNTEVDLSTLLKLADANNPAEKIESEFKIRPWLPVSKNTGYTANERLIMKSANAATQPIGTPVKELEVSFTIPTIETWCSTCKKVVHHDSIPYISRSPYHLNPDAVKEPAGSQTFVFDFQCVACKGAPLKFIVARNLNKIQLCGRSKPLMTAAPSFIPKNIRPIYLDALASANCGDTYAGFYHLRTLIEHHLKSKCGIDMQDSRDAESLCNEYYSKLDEVVARKAAITNEFKLCSKNLHGRTGTYDDFIKVLGAIDSHFKLIESLESLS